jgi:hypothetical protein
VPQIEVTFDIDADGILSVAAKEKSSNKEVSVLDVAKHRSGSYHEYQAGKSSSQAVATEQAAKQYERECEIGSVFARMTWHLSDRSPRKMHALIKDILGADVEMNPPLRHLIELPAFGRLMTQGGHSRFLVESTLLAEIHQTYHPSIASRVAAFLNGFLNSQASLEQNGTDSCQDSFQ